MEFRHEVAVAGFQVDSVEARFFGEDGGVNEVVLERIQVVV